MLNESHVNCLKETVFFGSLPQEVFDAVVAFAHTVNLRQGETIACQGDPAQAVFCVAAGAVKLAVVGQNGREVVVDIFERGATFAEALLFRHEAYPVTAVALKPSVVVTIPKSVIEVELRAKPETIPVVLSATHMHLHRLVHQIEHLKASSGLQRVAGFLLTLAERHKDQDQFEIPYEKQTIASMLGIKPETLSRSFRRLSDHGVRVSGPMVEVHDQDALRTFLEEA